MKTLEVKIPDEIFGILSVIAKKRDEFVIDAIKEKIVREKKHTLLVEGYQASFKEDLALADEFETADFENL